MKEKISRLFNPPYWNFLLLFLLLLILVISLCGLKAQLDLRGEAFSPASAEGVLQKSTSLGCNAYKLIDDQGKPVVDCLISLIGQGALNPYLGKKVITEGSQFRIGRKTYFLARSIKEAGESSTALFGTLRGSFVDGKGENYEFIEYYPSSSEKAPYPGIVFEHGSAAKGDYYTWVGKHLASLGYVVILPSVPDSFNVSTAGSKKWADAIKASIDYLVDQNAQEGRLKGMIDPNRLGIAGHSLGANGSLRAAYQDARIKAVVCLAPSYQEGIEDNVSEKLENVAKIKVPVQLQIGTKDSFCSTDGVLQYYNAITLAPKEYLGIKGATHVGFLDEGLEYQVATVLESFLERLGLMNKNSDPGSAISNQEQLRISKRYLTAWFDYFLKGDSNARTFIFGEESQKDLAAGILSRREFVEVPGLVTPPILPSTPTIPAGRKKVAVLKTLDYSGDEDIKKVLEKKYQVDIVNPLQIRNGVLKEGGYQVIVFPGGATAPLAVWLSQDFKEKVRDFVRNGGGYVGICGGAEAATKAVELNGWQPGFYEALGLIDAISETSIEVINKYLNDCGVFKYYLYPHPITQPQGDKELDITYCAGPILRLNTGSTQKMEVIAKFAEDLGLSLASPHFKGEVAAMTAEYGNGRVAVFSPHPEYLDSTEFLLLNAVEWVLGRL